MIRNTTVFDAFLSAKVTKGTGAAIINTCARLMRNDRSYQVKERDWNAHLSFKTATALNMAEGCTHPYARMPYDAMVNG